MEELPSSAASSAAFCTLLVCASRCSTSSALFFLFFAPLPAAPAALSVPTPPPCLLPLYLCHSLSLSPLLWNFLDLSPVSFASSLLPSDLCAQNKRQQQQQKNLYLRVLWFLRQQLLRSGVSAGTASSPSASFVPLLCGLFKGHCLSPQASQLTQLSLCFTSHVVFTLFFIAPSSLYLSPSLSLPMSLAPSTSSRASSVSFPVPLSTCLSLSHFPCLFSSLSLFFSFSPVASANSVSVALRFYVAVSSLTVVPLPVSSLSLASLLKPLLCKSRPASCSLRTPSFWCLLSISLHVFFLSTQP